MTLQQYRYIVEISKHNSISKAAAALYVTQPTISKAVQEMENELGITILDRTNKGVVFTKQGMELLFYAKMLLEQEESVVYHFNKQKTMNLTKFSISSQHYGFAIEAASNLMNYLDGRKYQLTIREGKATEVISDVCANRSILGVLSLTDLNKDFFEHCFISNSLIFTPLVSLRQHVFLRKEHPLAHLKSITLEQLMDYPYLTYQQNDVLLHFAEEAINLDNINKILYLEDRGAMNNILSNTNGYNIGTGCIVKNYMNPNIISIPLEGSNLIQVGFVKRDDIFLSEELLTYIDFLTKSLIESAPKNL
ncbi:LysR family transcriptional regulator [Clostridium luticellarii]|jgi:DNA-binding transcriptional LysR family regulator|uniref:HTH-type transcriptional regulator CysB n=1 Tax=Clostridium luticellarii TaxID=1691940 RepID=A0A2T0BJL1_9CLOT|nr:LysR family transcriptional regulator [Clostridium luticellarii]MCI1945725.1 LysR family transcriptional regulator [Clostridium luticellarii]MCI1969105.1 LysR family transcriptional regulator [Clostridium luticellarii]PRR84037.1 HTH-type transcriptional regulator CysB [Clostridium luticellarii]